MAIEATAEELEAGRGYEALFVPALFAPWVQHVIDAAGVEEGSHVLDVACGSGVLSRAAHARAGISGRVVGLDPAPGMIAAAAEVEPTIEWVLGSAEELPFDDQIFDCVVSQFGMMFFQDHTKAARDMYRVMKSGGRLALAVWHSVEENLAYRDVASILEKHVSQEAADAVRIPFGLGDPTPVAEILLEAGFDNVTFETKQEQANFPNTRTMIEVELRGWLPLFGINLTEEEITDVLAKSEPLLAKYASANGKAVFPTSAYMMRAEKT